MLGDGQRKGCGGVRGCSNSGWVLSSKGCWVHTDLHFTNVLGLLLKLLSIWVCCCYSMQLG